MEYRCGGTRYVVEYGGALITYAHYGDGSDEVRHGFTVCD